MRLNTDLAPVRQGEAIVLEFPGLKKGDTLIASPFRLNGPEPCAVLPPQIFLDSLATGPLPVGMTLALDSRPLLSVLSRFYLPQDADAHSAPCLRLLALNDVPAGPLRLVPQSGGPALAWVTVSDKGAVGLREDASGPAIAAALESAMRLRCANGYIVPDDIYRLRSLVLDLALTQGYDFIITSGGTGLTPRDITPEALLPLIEKRLPGLEQAMMQASLAATPRGALSRAVCGSVGASLLVTMPGSAKAVHENIQAVLGALGHGLEKLQGSPVDCGSL